MARPCRCGGSGAGGNLTRQLLTGKQLQQQPLKVSYHPCRRLWRALQLTLSSAHPLSGFVAVPV